MAAPELAARIRELEDESVRAAVYGLAIYSRRTRVYGIDSSTGTKRKGSGVTMVRWFGKTVSERGEYARKEQLSAYSSANE